MMTFLLYILSLFPLALFVIFLLWMDTFSLTKGKRFALSIINGAITCIIVLSIATWVFHESKNYELFIAPILDEILKGSIILYLVVKRKVILVGDATIYGASIGAGFGICENIFFLTFTESGVYPSQAIFYGFEAAVMHIGCTTTLAMMLAMIVQGRFGVRRINKICATAIAFALATLIHFIHSIGVIPPLLLTILLVIYFFVSKWSLFKKNERAIHEWIDNCINNDIALLSAIRNGKLTSTHAGQYLLSLKNSFSPEIFFDICCFISEYLELSIAAKSNLILKEAGLPIVKKEDSTERVAELYALKKRIGIKGMVAIQPIVKMKEVDEWATQEMI